jgi:tripartite-type tricarboxylate transporter receptor subunit TctC
MPHAARTRFALLFLAAAFACAPAHAQTFPAKPISLVVPFPPGGPTDAMARTIAARLKDELGQPVIVENKGGAGGNIGAEAVARAPADGYTLLFGTSGPLAINPSLYPKISYRPLRDFAPVIQIGHLPNVIVANPAVAAKTVPDLVALAKAKPGQLSYASSGNGASSHLAGVMFEASTGAQLLHVPYKGTGPALNDLLGGQVNLSFTDVLTAAPHVKAGKLRAIAVTTPARSRALPDVPTVAEQGVPGFDVSVFFGIVAPAATPEPVIARLNKAFRAALAAPDVRETLARQGLELAEDASPQRLAAFMKAEAERWAAIVKKSGAQLD